MENYGWLQKETEPKVLVQAVKLIGTKEKPGAEDSDIIMKWAKVLGLSSVYLHDETPWCGLYVAYVCYMAGKTHVKDPLWARNWLKWGTGEKVAMTGDILVFKRGTGGHVGFYVGEDETCYHVLGGNQSDAVGVARILKSRCLGIRRTQWLVKQPRDVRVIKLNSGGSVSTNEE